MKCKQCGNKISEDELYCPICGTKVTNEADKFNREINCNGKKNRKIIVGLIMIVSLIVIGIYFMMKPNDIHIEANELASLIAEEKSGEYYGDNLYVHGYLVRDENEGLYSLYSKDDDKNVLLFTFEDELDSDLGSGSEVTVKGNLGELTDSKFEVLIGKEITVQKKVPPVYQTDIEELIASPKKYIDKKVILTGKLEVNDDTLLILDDLDNQILLKGISKQELYEQAKRGIWSVIEGKFIGLDFGYALEVERISHNEATDLLNTNIEIRVDDVFENPKMYEGKVVTIKGSFPQSLIMSTDGRMIPVVFNNTHENYIELTGTVPPFGGCDGYVTGEITLINDVPVLYAQSYYE